MSKEHNTLPPCPHRLGFNCRQCYPIQWYRTNAIYPKRGISLTKY